MLDARLDARCIYTVGVRMEGETRVSIQSMEGGKLVLSIPNVG
jgi:hypothetical protein